MLAGQPLSFAPLGGEAGAGTCSGCIRDESLQRCVVPIDIVDAEPLTTVCRWSFSSASALML